MVCIESMGLDMSYQSDLIHFDPAPSTSGTAFGLIIESSEGPDSIVTHEKMIVAPPSSTALTDPNNVPILLVP